MRILLIGATGFLGRHICAHLLTQGHQLVAGVRDPAAARRRFPGIETLKLDLNELTSPAQWLLHLDGLDAVINCAGILQTGRRQSARSIHTDAPIALFNACQTARIPK